MISYAHSISTFCTFDIVLRCRSYSIRCRRSNCSISKVTNLRYRMSIRGSTISRFHDFDIDYRILISYTISKVALTFNIELEGHFIHIGIDIGYDIALSQYHSLRSRSSICPGSITLVPENLSATCPGFLLNPAPSFCAIPQLAPQRFDEKRSFHSATFTC
jgi:hypothetical protein